MKNETWGSVSNMEETGNRKKGPKRQGTKGPSRSCEGMERDCAKLEQRRVQWTKPKQEPLEKPTPRPKKPDLVDSDSEEDPSDADMDIDD